MTCKIERVLTSDGFGVLRVSGRIDGTYVETLRELMRKRKTKGLAIDLSEVTLVSGEAVEVLTVAESNLETAQRTYVNGLLDTGSVRIRKWTMIHENHFLRW
jgi:anti-anti-sigma regulatory factor